MKLLIALVSLAATSNLALLGGNTNEEKVPAAEAPSVSADSTSLNKLEDEDADGYLGYGYNMTTSDIISEPGSLRLSNPILDVNNSALRNAVKTFGSSQTIYESNEVHSAKEAAQSLGLLFNLGVNANISVVKANIGAQFDMTNDFSQVAKETYSYYNIYVKNRTVTLQMNDETLRSLLNPDFQSDLYKVSSESDAENLFSKYGTHMLRGYVLGGIFEMTNYFASDQTSYVRELGLGFSAQVGVAIGATQGGGGDFGFSANYASKDNNSHSINKYKCTTWGGQTFPGLTIDQAFSWYETLTQAGYVYQLWTDSINNGEHLVIVDLPDDSSLMPIWDLLPLTSQYNTQRTCLQSAYAKLCDKSYGSYLDANPDVFPTDLNDGNNPSASLPLIDSIGFDYSIPLANGEQLSSYVSAEINNSEPYEVERGSEIKIVIESSELTGKKLEYTANNENYVSELDQDNGYIKISDSATVNGKLIITISVDGMKLGTLKFKIRNGYSGGDGSSEHPYLIKDFDDLQKLSSNTGDWGNGIYFKMVSDIDCEGKVLSPIGNSTKPFSGTFDGNYYSIKNYKVDLTNAASTGNSVGLFGANAGAIKNLTVENDGPVMGNPSATYNMKCNGLSTLVNNIGGVVGENKNQAVISNVHVKNINIKVELPTSYKKDDSFKDYVYLGGVCGSNYGSVDNCSIDSSRLMIRGDFIKHVYCAGLIGLSDGQNIKSCSSTNNSIYARSGLETSGDQQRAEAGGLIGSLLSGSVSDVMVSDFNGEATSETASRIISLARGTAKNANLVSIAGGLIGYAKEGTTICRAAIYDMATVQSLYYVPNGGTPAKGVNTHFGLFVGHFDGAEDPGTNMAKYIKDPEGGAGNIFVDRTGDIPDFASVSTDDCGTIPGYNNISQFPQISESGEFKSDTWELVNGMPAIVSVRPSDNDADYIFSGMKTEFFVGDRFSLGNVSVSGITNSGDEFALSEFRVDYSAFRSDIPGIYIIKLYAYGIEYDYSVTVSQPEPISLEMTEEPTKNEYYEGEVFDTTGMVLEVVYENGYRKQLNPGEYSMSSTDLENGVNTVTFTYKEGDIELTYDYYIAGKTRIVESIKIISTPNNTTYTVGSTEINTDGLVIEVTYEDGGTEIVTGEDCELIFGTVASGNNTVMVAYKGYKTASFQIQGKYNVSQEKIDKFVQTVESIEDAETLAEKKELIDQAMTMLEEIGPYEADDYNEAVEKLNQQKEEYDSSVNQINDDFGSTFGF